MRSIDGRRAVARKPRANSGRCMERERERLRVPFIAPILETGFRGKKSRLTRLDVCVQSFFAMRLALCELFDKERTPARQGRLGPQLIPRSRSAI
jgi:hypothetical protein